MALTWDWKDKIGELNVVKYGRELKINIYEGNALAIFIHEFKDESGTNLYELFTFFCDKAHFKNCANDKTYDFFEGWKKITLSKVPTEFWFIVKELVKRGIAIEIKGKESDND